MPDNFNSSAGASSNSTMSLDNMTVLNRVAVLATYKIYDTWGCLPWNTYSVYVPSVLLTVGAVSLVVAGAFSSISKPKNANDPSPYHPLFDPSDVGSIPLDEEAEVVNKFTTRNAIMMPVLSGAALLGLKYALQNSLKDIVQTVLKKYMVATSLMSNYSSVNFFLKTGNRLLCHKFGINPLDIIGKYRIVLANDTALSPSGVIVNDDKMEADNFKFRNALLSIIGLSIKKDDKKNISEDSSKEKGSEEKKESKQSKLDKLRDELSTTVDKKEQLANVFFSSADITSLLVSCMATYAFATNTGAGSKNWILSNIIGSSHAIWGMQNTGFSSFRAAFLLLGLLFFYDIYFVFYSDAMVTVATGIDIPVKLVFPHAPEAPITDGVIPAIKDSMLGLGDIVIPGSLVSLALRFDLFNYHAANPQTEFHHLNKYSKPYFYSSITGYILGLGLTNYCLHYFSTAQPALLYLCPSVILAIIVVSLVRGEFLKLWNFSDDEESEKKDSDESKPKTWKAFLEVDLPEEDEEDEDYDVLVIEDEEEDEDEEDDEYEEDEDDVL
ncbi:aspartic endopeptidase [Saccharomycopsis crataegensis]|uniref:Aspartic endopeptidase n=1 Tax=Saccharomycopsis crataegensis TaxID=43959 RepID=A0AAV5QDK8_9ASCO|nr:aspartic endopeptidase [Saccharomycopsis crataegensis]